MSIDFKKLYKDKIIDQMQEKFNYKNKMQIPQVKKIVINMGVGEAAADSKVINAAIDDLTLIAGQKPVQTKAKKSIAGFKLREGQSVGCKVTLRGQIMYEFLQKLVYVALPRVRDFRGLSPKAFDGQGNYSLGLKEQIVWPEIDYDKIDKIRGMDINIITSATNDNEARELLKCFNIPFYGQTKEQ